MIHKLTTATPYTELFGPFDENDTSRHSFAAVNGAGGFRCYFDEIFGKSAVDRLYLLGGGMRRVDVVVESRFLPWIRVIEGQPSGKLAAPLHRHAGVLLEQPLGIAEIRKSGGGGKGGKRTFPVKADHILQAHHPLTVHILPDPHAAFRFEDFPDVIRGSFQLRCDLG